MHGVAEDVFQLPLAPRNAINAYLLGDVLVDAGLRSSAQRILAALGGRTIAAHAITHADADHAGASRRIAETLGVEVWIGAGDADALAAGVPVAPAGRAVGRPEPTLVPFGHGPPLRDPARLLAFTTYLAR